MTKEQKEKVETALVAFIVRESNASTYTAAGVAALPAVVLALKELERD
jgi:hypothetical protein